MAILNSTASNDIKKPSHSKLFTPLKLGRLDLKHRIIMAPLTRVRSPEHIPNENVVEYYGQRANDGGLIITEATHISVMGGNYHDAPGIFTPEHVRAWKKVTDAVHRKGGFIYCQLWHVGRTTHPLNLGGRAPLAPSAIKFEGQVHFTREGPKDAVTPKEMTIQDIRDTIEDYGHAAKCAIEAGFDGVEIHAANGYLMDQFICDNINRRTDSYGGNAQNRGRIVLEVVDKVISAVGGDASRVGIRFSPFGSFQDTDTSDIHEHYGYVISNLESRGLSYVHLIEPRPDPTMPEPEKFEKALAIAKSRGVPDDKLAEYVTLKPFRDMLKTTPLIVAGGYNDTNAPAPIETGRADAIVFGRYFISNPDIVERLKNSWALSPYDRKTFYTSGPRGYTDYPVYAGLEAPRL